MSNIEIGDKESRTFTYDGILQASVSPNTYQYKFIQEMTVTLDDTDLDRDRVDDGTPAFTRVGDVLGSFAFTLKNAVDLYDLVDPPPDEWLVSFWMNELVKNTPAEVEFIQTFKATDPNAPANPFARVRFKGRVMKVTPGRLRDTGVDEITIEGEVIAFTNALREAT